MKRFDAAAEYAKHEDLEYLRFNKVKSNTFSENEMNEIEKAKLQKIALLKQKSLDKKRKNSFNNGK